MNESLIELRHAPHTSISAIKEYLACPRRYFLKYVEHVEPDFRPAAFAFGSAWHATIGRWLGAPEATQEELHAHLRDELVTSLHEDGSNVLFDDEDQDEGKLVDTAITMLDVFTAKVPRPEKALAVELSFSLELAHPVTGEILPVPLVGAIDAIVLSGGVGAVWELKTAKKKWSPDQLEFDLQSTAYRMAARAMGYQDVEVTLLVATKTKRPDVQIERLVRHARDERELVETAFTVIRGTEAGIDHRVRGWACRVCPYAAACGA